MYAWSYSFVGLNLRSEDEEFSVVSKMRYSYFEKKSNGEINCWQSEVLRFRALGSLSNHPNLPIAVICSVIA